MSDTTGPTQSGSDPGNRPTDIPSDDSPSRLPLGWDQATTPEGRVYFIDHNAGVTTFDDPRVTPGLGVHIEAQVELERLPAGWEQRISQPDARPYFINHISQTST